MWKGMVLGLIGAVLTIGAAAGSSYAQAASVYPVKFVCGTQQPQLRIIPPAEPAVKPGNYATVINVEAFGNDTTVKVVASPANATSPTPLPDLVFTIPFTTKDITCADIQAAVKAPAGTFITGFVNVTSQQLLSVTAVYTSQGCLFPLQPLSIFVPPVCTGPTSIDVVVQSPVDLPQS